MSVQRRTGNRLLSARFMVGFNPNCSVESLISLFVEIRHRQGRSAGATFLPQRGIWDPIGIEYQRLRLHDGAQIVLMNEEDGLDQNAFTDEMIQIGEELVRRMEQVELFLDIQCAGLIVDSMTVTVD